MSWPPSSIPAAMVPAIPPTPAAQYPQVFTGNIEYGSINFGTQSDTSNYYTAFPAASASQSSYFVLTFFAPTGTSATDQPSATLTLDLPFEGINFITDAGSRGSAAFAFRIPGYWYPQTPQGIIGHINSPMPNAGYNSFDDKNGLQAKIGSNTPIGSLAVYCAPVAPGDASGKPNALVVVGYDLSNGIIPASDAAQGSIDNTSRICFTIPIVAPTAIA